MSEEKLSKLLKDGYILMDNNGKIEVMERPEFGSIAIRFNDNKPVIKDTVTKEKFN